MTLLKVERNQQATWKMARRDIMSNILLVEINSFLNYLGITKMFTNTEIIYNSTQYRDITTSSSSCLMIMSCKFFSFQFFDVWTGIANCLKGCS